MTILAKGDQVSFFRASDGKKLTLPKHFQIVHDTTGSTCRHCDVFVCAIGPRTPRNVTTGTDEDARNYFGKSARLAAKVVDLPRGPWSRLALVDAIWYRRPFLGELVPYEHPYNPEVWLYVSRTEHAYKIALPDGCSIDERGFVWP